MKKILIVTASILIVLTSCVLINPPEIEVEGLTILGRDIFLKVKGSGIVSWDLNNDGVWDLKNVPAEFSIPFFCSETGSKKIIALVKDGQKTWRISKTINVVEAESSVLSLKGYATREDLVSVELVGTNFSVMGMDISIDYDVSSLEFVRVDNLSSGVLMPVVDGKRFTIAFLDQNLHVEEPTSILRLTFSVRKKGCFVVNISGTLRNSLNEDVEFLNFGTRIVKY